MEKPLQKCDVSKIHLIHKKGVKKLGKLNNQHVNQSIHLMDKFAADFRTEVVGSIHWYSKLFGCATYLVQLGALIWMSPSREGWKFNWFIATLDLPEIKRNEVCRRPWGELKNSQFPNSDRNRSKMTRTRERLHNGRLLSRRSASLWCALGHRKCPAFFALVEIDNCY